MVTMHLTTKKRDSGWEREWIGIKETVTLHFTAKDVDKGTGLKNRVEKGYRNGGMERGGETGKGFRALEN